MLRELLLRAPTTDSALMSIWRRYVETIQHYRARNTMRCVLLAALKDKRVALCPDCGASCLLDGQATATSSNAETIAVPNPCAFCPVRYTIDALRWQVENHRSTCPGLVKAKAPLYKHLCTYPDCKANSFVEFICRDCKANYCLKHRYAAKHQCKGAEAASCHGQARSRQRDARQMFTVQVL